jgi:hypothetical protein
MTFVGELCVGVVARGRSPALDAVQKCREEGSFENTYITRLECPATPL